MRCKNCGNEKPEYSIEFDAYYCKSCNEWLEKVCSDPDCDYCKNRPSNPEGNKEERK